MRLGEALQSKETIRRLRRKVCCRFELLRYVAWLSSEEPGDVLAFGQGGCGVISGPSVHKLFTVLWTGAEAITEEFSTVLYVSFFQCAVAERLHVESRDLTIN